MQRIGREDHARQAEFRDEERHGRNLVRCASHLVVRQDQRAVASKSAQHMCGGLIMQVIETASQRLAIQCDGPPAMPVDRLIKVTRVAAKGGLQIGRVEREKEVP